MNPLSNENLVMTHEQTKKERKNEQDKVSNDNQYAFYLMLFTVSLQSLFLGFALSIQTFKHGITFTPIALSLCLYKWIEALTVGYSFVENNIGIRTSFEYTLFFSFATPLGIVVGMFLDEYDVVRGVLMGCGAGSFIYVSAVECLNLEFMTYDKTAKILKYLS